MFHKVKTSFGICQIFRETFFLTPIKWTDYNCVIWVITHKYPRNLSDRLIHLCQRSKGDPDFLCWGDVFGFTRIVSQRYDRFFKQSNFYKTFFVATPWNRTKLNWLMRPVGYLTLRPPYIILKIFQSKDKLSISSLIPLLFHKDTKLISNFQIFFWNFFGRQIHQTIYGPPHLWSGLSGFQNQVS